MKRLLAMMLLVAGPCFAQADESLRYLFNGSPVMHVLTASGPRPSCGDLSTHALGTINHDEAMIHCGKAYTVASSSHQMSASTTFTMLLVTPPNGERIHLLNQLESTGEGQILWADQVVVATYGTEITPQNRNFNHPNASKVHAYIGSTYSSYNIIRNFRVGAGKATGGSMRSTSAWVLAPSSSYAITFTAQANGVYAELKSDWYEFADRN